MAKTKTTATGASVMDFISEVPDERKRDDSYALIDMMQRVTGEKPYMWGPSIIGFGNYHYKYASGHEGDAPIAGFSPRKPALTLYFAPEFPGREKFLQQLGKHKACKSCVYIKKLEDVDLDVLEKMTRASVKYTEESTAVGTTKLKC